MIKRVFLVILDSLGIGSLPDADEFGDVGSNTLKTLTTSKELFIPALTKMGLFNIDKAGLKEYAYAGTPIACYGAMAERSKGKDTVTGHWEIAGIISERPFPTYPSGFPDIIIDEFCARTGKDILCNRPYSGTEVIKDYGEEHIRTGKLIIYTSADSVFQIAAHESVIPLDELYGYCRTAREILKDEHAVGRVIARPFSDRDGVFYRTAGRHDYSLEPIGETLPDILKESGRDVISIGKINDIFASRGITESNPTKSNHEGEKTLLEMTERDFYGLCFVNLVDFDMLYGHRNDIDGYAAALSEFDKTLSMLLDKLNNDDLLILTADHGCDPGFSGTDHTREYVPLLVYGRGIKRAVNLGTRSSFSDVGATAAEALEVRKVKHGESFFDLLI